MFITTVRLSSKRFLAGIIALVLVVGVGVVGLRALSNSNTMTSVPTSEQGSGTKGKIKKNAKNEEERLAFIKAFGWEVDPQAAEILEVIIPKEFDEVYTSYNTLQKLQGFDLEKFAGKRVKRYSYVITNYPGAEGEIRINLLIYKNKVIGGDVSSMDAQGFMHGFTME